MKKMLSLAGLAFVAIGIATFPALSARAGDSAHLYAGATKCKTCHGKEEIGDQYKVWSESKHAHAMESLKTDKAREWGAKKGIADPSTAKECVECHTTAYTAPAELKGSKYSIDEGVSCEACHGAGNDYKKKSTMIDVKLAEAAGLVPQTEQVCTQCHNDKSPAWTSFDYAAAKAKIAHPVPEGYDPNADEEEE
ncbi:MAG: cytochrome C554 [Deltaproteobacteria bacterium]|nr:cytochrome C554 [Deltaproteobacteria bacterium]